MTLLRIGLFLHIWLEIRFIGFMLQDKFDFGFALDWMIKDLGIAIEEAGRHGAKLPGTETILSYYKKLSAQGYGRLDTSALIKRLR